MENAMKHTKVFTVFVLGLILALAGSAFGQEKVFEWQPANDESVRLDPANYHTGRTYRPGPNGGNMHVDIKAQNPVTIFLAPAGQWDQVLQDPRRIVDVQQLCLREHVVDTTYVCDLPPEPMTLIIHDERNSLDPAVFAVLGAVLDRHDKTDRAIGAAIATVATGQSPVTRRFLSPNDAHIQYYRWACVENCIQPEFQWFRQLQEKYELTSILKLYGGFAPDHDGTQITIKIKSPAPMVVAMLPSSVANQLHARPETFEPALANNNCQQRGVQSLQFDCTFDVSDGPQSLVVVPESTARIPKGKKAEIEMSVVKCVANCAVPPDKP
jgi:hypothetical protein